MKKPIQLNKFFSLNKETITRLNEEQLGEVAGGQGADAFTITCNKGDELQGAEDGDLKSCIACSCTGGTQ